MRVREKAEPAKGRADYQSQYNKAQFNGREIARWLVNSAQFNESESRALRAAIDSRFIPQY